MNIDKDFNKSHKVYAITNIIYPWALLVTAITIFSQPNKCLKFMTFLEGCFVIHVEYKHLPEALETFYHRPFYKR